MSAQAQREKANADLLPRKKPTQGRSKKTVEKVLTATRRILETDGHRGLTTHTVAKASGVTVGSIYQYFPSKHAIIYALYTGWLDDVVARLDDILADANSNLSAEEKLAQMFQTFINEDDEDRFSRELIAAMQAHPELDSVEALHQKRITERIAPLLGDISGVTDTATLYAFAVALYGVSVPLMDVVRETPAENRDQIETWAKMTAASALSNFVKARERTQQKPPHS